QRSDTPEGSSKSPGSALDTPEGPGSSSDTSEDGTGTAQDAEAPLLPPANCCMSGCARCVWTCYAEELLRRHRGAERALAALEQHVHDESTRALLRLEIRLRAGKE
ncbi:OXLD1 protein, partial [Crypturellus undulatus]|nr:OXLD1 protein [Crypturellus undulatus]